MAVVALETGHPDVIAGVALRAAGVVQPDKNELLGVL